MTAGLVELPKKDSKSFWHPESHELILTSAAIITTFTFWNAINLRPSILTDPGYGDQYGGLRHHMNLSMAVILGISAMFAAVYGEKGYLPALGAISAGALMFVWTNTELSRHADLSGAIPEQQNTDAEALSLRAHTNYPIMFQPMYIQKNRREAAMIS